MSRYRFPGLRSFEESEAPLFKGREREKQTLFDLIVVERCVVMFAKSGAGKSSLLQAGIVPMLDGLSYQPVFIRLNRVGQPLLQQMTLQIAQVFGVAPTPGQSLWEYLKVVNSNSGDTVPILFFDQFEEIFTLYDHAETRRAFIVQLADVLNGHLPFSVESALQNLDIIPDGSQLVEMEKPPRVKMVFSIRSDLLSYFHELSDYIPGILRNRFELKGLSLTGATDAITLPAALQDSSFECPPFEVSPEALQDILQKLTERKDIRSNHPEVESFQLQLICNELEKKMLQQHQHNAPLKVDIETYGGKKGIDDLLFRFYKETLDGIPDAAQQKNARIVIEDTLVQNERRVSVAESTLLSLPGLSLPTEKETSPESAALSLETLWGLVDKRLLRKEERPGLGNYYELMHDTLLGPVLRYKSERKIREAEEKTKVAFRRKIRRWLVVGSIVAILMLAAFALLFYVNKLKNETLYSYLVLQSKLQTQQDPTLAFRLAEAAWNILPDSIEAQGSIINAFYGNLLPLDDTLFAAPHYREYDATLAQPTPGNNMILMLHSDRRTLTLINPSNNEERVCRPQGTTPIENAFLSPDGRRVLTIHPNDSIARMWDVGSGSLLKSLVHEGPLNSAAFSPDGRFLTTNASDESQRLWTAGGDFLQKYTNLATTNMSMVFSPDSKVLLVGKNDTIMELYVPGAAAPFAVLRASIGTIEQVQFAHSSQFIAMTSVDWADQEGVQVQVFDLQGKRIFEKRTTNNVGLVKINDTGTEMLLVSADTLQKIELATNLVTALGPMGSRVIFTDVSSDHQMMAFLRADKTVQLWSENKPVLNLQYPGKPGNFFFSADGRNLIIGTREGKLRIWALKNNPIVRLNTTEVPVRTFFKPGTHEVVAQDFSGNLYSWDAVGKPQSVPEWLKKGSRIAQDGRSVLAPAEKGWHRVDPLSGVSSAVHLPDADPDGNDTVEAAADVAVMLRNRQVEVFREKQKTATRLLLDAHYIALDICLSSDGKYLGLLTQDTSSTARDYRLEWWSVVQQRRLDTATFEKRVNRLVCSTGNKSLLIGTASEVYEWTLKSPPVLFLSSEQGEGWGITALAVSKNGQWIAAGGSGNKVLLCDGLGRVLHTFNIPYGSVRGLQFSDDGQYLLSRHFQKAIFVWPLAPVLLQQKLNVQQVRQLTEQELRVYKLK